MPKPLLTLPAVFLFCFPVLLHAQWTKTNGLPGGSIDQFVHAGGGILAVCGTLYYSDNGGQSWTPQGTLPGGQFGQVAADGQALVARWGAQGTSGKGLAYSPDLGQTWTPVDYPDTMLFYELFLAGSFIYGADYRGIYRTADFGATWEYVTKTSYSAIQYDGQRMVGYRSSEVLESTDGGFTWHQLMQTIPSGGGIQLLQHENYLFVFQAKANGGCWVSTDYGQNWQHYTGTAFGDYRNFIWHNGTLFGLFSHKIIRSDDLGKTWQESPLPVSGTYSYRGISTGNALLICGSFNGILRSTDGGDSWFPANLGLEAQSSRALRGIDNNLYAVGQDEVYRLAPDGLNWSPLHLSAVLPPGYQGYTDYARLGGNHLLMAEGVPFVSLDNGINWYESTVAGSSPGHDFFYAFGVVNDRVLLSPNYPESFSSFVSENHGLTFQWLSTLGQQFNANALTIAIQQGKTYAMGRTIGSNSSNFVYQSDDAGQTWSVFGQPLPADSLAIIFLKKNCNLFVHGNVCMILNSPGSSLNNKKYLYSADAGATWTFIDMQTAGLSGLTYPGFNDLATAGNYFIGATYAGVFISADAGQHWSPWSPEFQEFCVENLEVHDGFVWVSVRDRGIWKRPLDDLSLLPADGKAFYDTNINGIQDAGEQGMPNLIVYSDLSGASGKTVSDGSYSLYSSLLSEKLRITPPAPYWTVSPGSQPVNLPATGADFALSLPPDAKDLSVTLTNSTVPRPGFEFDYVLTWANNVPLPAQNATLTFTYPANRLELLSVSLPPSTQSAGMLSWALGDPSPNTSGVIVLRFKVPATAGIGTEICVYTVFSPLAGDLTPQDNTRERCLLTRGSYDPNDKQAEPADYFSLTQLANREAVDFTVRFQNTGNFPATFVRVLDTISAAFDISTFRLLATSHPCSWTLRNPGVVEFYYPNIQLPPESTDEPGSHGFVRYTVQPHQNLTLGTPLRNTAHIFFDYNAPITTNTTETVISQETHTGSTAEESPLLRVAPNPAQTAILVDVPETGLLSVYDGAGRLVWQMETAAGKRILDLNNWPEGVYNISLRHENGAWRNRFVIQR